jgi:hypothetical protein
VRRATVLGAGKGAHGIVDTARCPACREPARLHNAAGNVRADCECTVPYGSLNVPAASFPEAVVPTAASAAPAGRPAAVEAPRRTDPRPAGDALVLPPAAVGGDDVGARAAASVEQAAAVPRAAAALDDIAELVQQVLDRAYFFTVRWYCPSCHDWPLDPGACGMCTAALQPVYLATLPREV